MSSKRKKANEKPAIEDNSNFVRMVVYTVVGVLGVFVVAINIYNYMNPRGSVDDDNPDENVAKVEENENGPTAIIGQLQKLRQDEKAIPPNAKEELIAHFRKRIGLCDELIKTAETEQQKTDGYGEKLQLFVKLNSIGAESAQDELNAFVKSLEQVEIDYVKYMGRVAYLTAMIDRQIYASKDPDFQPFFDEVESDMANYQDDVRYSEMVRRFIQQLIQARKSKEALQFIELLLPYYRDSNNPELQNQVVFLEGLRGMEKHNIKASFTNLIRGKEGAENQFVEALQKMIDDQSINQFSFSEITTALGELEKSNRYDAARVVNQAVADKLGNYSDTQIALAAKEISSRALKRLDMMNRKFEPEAFDLEGKPFDLGQFQGDVTILLFISFRNQNSMQAFDNLLKSFGQQTERNFRIAGCLVDQKPWEGVNWIKANAPYWTKFPIMITSPDENTVANGLIDRLGIVSLPYGIILDANGIVRDIDVIQGTMLKSLQDVREGKTGEPKLDDNMTDSVLSNGKSEKSQSKSDKQEDQPLSSVRRLPRFAGSYRRGLLLDRPEMIADFVSIQDADRSIQDTDTRQQAETSNQEQEQEQEQENPYLAPAHWSKSDLVDFILKMEEKPRSIRRRRNFALAIADAADRVLADDSASKVEIRIASLGKTEILHEHGCLGDEELDKALWDFIRVARDLGDQKLKLELEFLRLEQKLIAAVDAPKADNIENLLTISREFFEQTKSLTGRHLRLASTSIELINRLESEDPELEKELALKRDALYKDFGKLFAVSEDKRMAKYGKYLTKSTGSASALVGKPLELAGLTVNGTEFDWKSYRKKIVVVDFWATWCGPCRKEMPNVKALYEKLNQQGFEVVGVALDDDEQAVSEYVSENNIPWENLVGPKAKELAQQYGVKGIPTMMLIDRDGNVLAVANRVGQLEAEIQKQLK